MDKIRFEGEISQESKNYILKKNRGGGVIIAFLTFLTLSPFLLFFGYKVGLLIFSVPFVVLLALSIVVVAIFPQINIPLKHMERYYPLLVIITEDEISYENKSFESYHCEKLADIKRVEDCGNFYYFAFYFSLNCCCVCQKDLITLGTIKEFEEMFKDKIVRKVK